MIPLEQELSERSRESGLSVDLLRAVYLRATSENSAGGPQVRRSALERVDRFVAFATGQSQASCIDRDLTPHGALTASAPRPTNVTLGALVRTEHGDGLVVKIGAQAATVRVQDSIYSVRFSELTTLAV